VFFIHRNEGGREKKTSAISSISIGGKGNLNMLIYPSLHVMRRGREKKSLFLGGEKGGERKLSDQAVSLHIILTIPLIGGREDREEITYFLGRRSLVPNLPYPLPFPRKREAKRRVASPRIVSKKREGEEKNGKSQWREQFLQFILTLNTYSKKGRGRGRGEGVKKK